MEATSKYENKNKIRMSPKLNRNKNLKLPFTIYVENVFNPQFHNWKKNVFENENEMTLGCLKKAI